MKSQVFEYARVWPLMMKKTLINRGVITGFFAGETKPKWWEVSAVSGSDTINASEYLDKTVVHLTCLIIDYAPDQKVL